MNYKGPLKTCESFIARGCENTKSTEKNAARYELLYSINLAITLTSKYVLSIYCMEDVLSSGNMSKKVLSL